MLYNCIWQQMQPLVQVRGSRASEESNSELLSESETSWPFENPPGSQGPGDAAPGASPAQGKRPPPRPPSSSSGSQKCGFGCDVSYQSDLVRVDNLPAVDMSSPDEEHVWGALDEGRSSTCHSKAW